MFCHGRSPIPSSPQARRMRWASEPCEHTHNINIITAWKGLACRMSSSTLTVLLTRATAIHTCLQFSFTFSTAWCVRSRSKNVCFQIESERERRSSLRPASYPCATARARSLTSVSVLSSWKGRWVETASFLYFGWYFGMFPFQFKCLLVAPLNVRWNGWEGRAWCRTMMLPSQWTPGQASRCNTRHNGAPPFCNSPL